MSVPDARLQVLEHLGTPLAIERSRATTGIELSVAEVVELSPLAPLNRGFALSLFNPSAGHRRSG